MHELVFFEREFEIRFLKSRGTAFQDLFSDLMERAYPGDFQRIRPHGNTGDLKCDGYLHSLRTVFQVYGPDDMRSLSRLLRKVKEDFEGARQHWMGRIDRWVFVHNSQGGLPAQAIQLLNDLGGGLDAVRIEHWGYQELCGILRKIDPDRLRSFFQLSAVFDPAHVLENLPNNEDVRRYLTWAVA